MKTQMKARQVNLQKDITASKKELRKAEKGEEHKTVNRLHKEIDWMERQKKFYGARVEPVRFANGFVLNGQLLKQFVKKLPAVPLSAEFSERGDLDIKQVEINYRSGKLTLLNLDMFYQDIDLPKGEEFFDELGISLS